MSEMEPPRYVYVFVRTDLPLADQMVQVGHICLEAATTFAVPPRSHLALLGVPNRAALEQAMDDCRARGIRLVTFVEPDPADEISGEPMGLTAACTEPLNALKRKRLRRFRLWRERSRVLPDSESGY